MGRRNSFAIAQKEGRMTKTELITRLQTLIDDAERLQMFGSIEIEVREGAPILIRTIRTEKIQCTGNQTHAKTNRY
jgi:hypothetical protein